MKNREKWQPTKFGQRRGRLVASRDRNELKVGSRLIANLTAGLYDKYLPRHAKGRLLDLGCGKVPLYAAYKDHVTEIICVDWANTEHDNEFLDVECDITEVLPFANAEFDTIILSDVLEHIPKPEDLWKEMSRILSPNGKIIMNVPFFYWLHARPHDYHRYTEFALRRLADNSGMKVILLEPIGGSPEIVTDIIGKHIQLIPLIGKSVAIAIQSITLFFVRTALGNMISRKTAEIFPLAYFLIAEKPK